MKTHRDIQEKKMPHVYRQITLIYCTAYSKIKKIYLFGAVSWASKLETGGLYC